MEKANNNFQLRKKRFMVHPCVIDGQRTLIYERGLKEKNSAAFRALVHYAKLNDYFIKEDRRADFIEGVKRVKNPHNSNVITIMVLVASLISQGVVAGDLDSIGLVDLYDNVEQMQVEPYMDLEASTFSTIKELMNGLLQWINQHTSFEHQVDSLPKVSFVNKQKIADIAFGEDAASKIDISNVNILGLYNFYEKTIYLLDTVDLKTEAGKGILLHELVHYLQYEESMNKKIKHITDLEALAYSIEARYLTEQKI